MSLLLRVDNNQKDVLMNVPLSSVLCLYIGLDKTVTCCFIHAKVV